MVDLNTREWKTATRAQLLDADASLAAGATQVGAIRRHTTDVRDTVGRLNDLAQRYLGLFNQARDVGNCLARHRADIELLLSRHRFQAMPTFAALKNLDIAAGPIRIKSRGDVDLALNEEMSANPQAALARLSHS